MPTHLKVIPTNDSSKTIYNAKLKETYHSINGAVTESIHVYINAGLKYFYNKNNGNKIINIITAINLEKDFEPSTKNFLPYKSRYKPLNESFFIDKKKFFNNKATVFS